MTLHYSRVLDVLVLNCPFVVCHDIKLDCVGCPDMAKNVACPGTVQMLGVLKLANAACPKIVAKIANAACPKIVGGSVSRAAARRRIYYEPGSTAVIIQVDGRDVLHYRSVNDLVETHIKGLLAVQEEEGKDIKALLNKYRTPSDIGKF